MDDGDEVDPDDVIDLVESSSSDSDVENVDVDGSDSDVEWVLY